jgi:hypothetical protein
MSADLAAVGHIALQLYGQQERQRGCLTVLSAGEGAPCAAAAAADQLCSLSSLPSLQQVPAAVALFVQQCCRGEFTVHQLLQSDFFPAWMNISWKFMVKLLFSQCELEGARQCNGDLWAGPCDPCDCSGSAGMAGQWKGRTNSINSNASSSWQQHDAFAALAQLSLPDGELQLLSAVPPALQLCLPAVLHVLRSTLLLPWEQQQRQQQTSQQASQFIDHACLIVLSLTAAVSAAQLQQHVSPLLVDMLSADKGSTAAATATAACGDATAGTLPPARQQHPAAVQATACRRAVLQPLLWKLLVRQLPLQQLLQHLLPPLIAAALEPLQDWLPAAADVVLGDGGEQHCGHQQQQQQQQSPVGFALQADLAAACLAVLASCLPFPVVAQNILRPLLLALPWVEASSSSSSSSSSSNDDVCGAGAALVAVGRVLPPQLAADFVFQPVLQIALLPLLLPPDSSSSSSSGPATVTVARHTAPCVPVLEGLFLHVAPVLQLDTLMPDVSLEVPPQVSPAVPAVSPASPAAPSGATPVSPGAPAQPWTRSDRAAAAYSGDSVTSGTGSSSSMSGSAAAAEAEGTRSGSQQQHSTQKIASTSAVVSPAAAAAAVPSVQQQQQQRPQQVADLCFHHLADLLLLPPDDWTVDHSPALYPRVAALLLLGLEQACGSSSSSSTEEVKALYWSWLLPQVLTPLLNPSTAAAWQQQQQQQQQQGVPVVDSSGSSSSRLSKVYWRVVLLLYAAAVPQLGLSAVRSALSDWHSVEVRAGGIEEEGYGGLPVVWGVLLLLLLLPIIPMAVLLLLVLLLLLPIIPMAVVLLLVVVVVVVVMVMMVLSAVAVLLLLLPLLLPNSDCSCSCGGACCLIGPCWEVGLAC